MLLPSIAPASSFTLKLLGSEALVPHPHQIFYAISLCSHVVDAPAGGADGNFSDVPLWPRGNTSCREERAFRVFGKIVVCLVPVLRLDCLVTKADLESVMEELKMVPMC